MMEVRDELTRKAFTFPQIIRDLPQEALPYVGKLIAEVEAELHRVVLAYDRSKARQ